MSQNHFAASFLLLALLCNFWTHVYIFAAFLCSLYFAQIYQILKSLGNGPCTTHTKQSDVQQQNFIFLCLKRTLSVFYLFLWGLPLSLGIVLEKGHFEEIAMTILINVFCNQIFSSCADNFPSIWCELILISCCISFAPRRVIFDRIHPFLCTYGTFNSFNQL